MRADGGSPKMVANIGDPRNFIAVDNSTACFTFNTGDWYDGGYIACTNDGVEINKTEEAFNFDYYRGKITFFSNGLIWFKTSVPSDLEGYGDMLYSVDPFNLNNVSLYSSLSEKNEEPSDDSSDNEGCTSAKRNRIRFLSLLFLSAIPSLMVAIAIGFVFKIPSMPVSAYLSTTWVVICLIFTINPDFDNMDDFFSWWFVLTSGPWLIRLTLAHLTNSTTKSRLGWGVNFAGLVYFIGMLILLPVFGTENDVFWKWALLTIFIIPPLFVMGVITRQVFLMVLASIVIMMDVFRLTAYISAVAGLEDSLPVQFVVLGLSGLALGFLGYILSKRQSQVESAVSNWAKKSSLGRWVTDSENDEVNDDDGVDA